MNLVSKDLKCIQIHIPKTAGVSIRKALFNKEPDKFMHWYPSHPEYKKYIKDFFTFTFVRNPWDRIVSCYEFCFIKSNSAVYKDITKYENFESFLLNINLNHILNSQRFEPQMNWIRKSNGIVYDINYYGFFEKIEEDFKEICKKLHIKKPHLDVLNKNNKRKHKDYREYYTNDKLVDIVYTMYKEEIDFFNYSFED